MTVAQEEIYERLELPQGVEWYEVQGVRIFPMYAGNGSIRASFYACLIRRDCLKWSAAGISVNLSDDEETVKTKFAEALTRFVELNPDGGVLPSPSGGWG